MASSILWQSWTPKMQGPSRSCSSPNLSLPRYPASRFALCQSIPFILPHSVQHAALSSVSAQYLRERKVYALWLDFKPGGQDKASQRGAMEVQDNFLTLDAAKQLIKIVFSHVSRSVSIIALGSPVSGLLRSTHIL